MGLDNYASRSAGEVVLTSEDEAAFAAAGIDLCGGLESDGQTSIRGEHYELLIWRVTGISIRQEWLPPDRVATLSARLSDYTPEELAELWDEVDPYPSFIEMAHSEDETEELQRFFEVCAERNLGLVGWS